MKNAGISSLKDFLLEKNAEVVHTLSTRLFMDCLFLVKVSIELLPSSNTSIRCTPRAHEMRKRATLNTLARVFFMAQDTGRFIQYTLSCCLPRGTCSLRLRT